MTQSTGPRWLDYLERRIGWVATPQLGIVLIALQILGYLSMMRDESWASRLVLDPELALSGEPWRLLTFLAVPVSLHPLWLLLALWFLYFVVNMMESAWGAFRTTFYVLCAVSLTVIYSLVTGYSVTDARHLHGSLFLAAAMLFPDFEVLLFFIVPVKLKWLGIIAGVWTVATFVFAGWPDRGYLLAIYSSFFLFFGVTAWNNYKQRRRLKSFQDSLKR